MNDSAATNPAKAGLLRLVIFPLHSRSLRHGIFGGLCFPVIVALASTSTSLAEIRFREVTEQAGLVYRGPTYGAAWGDFNEDGWPDLWVGNHYRQPTLYLNRKDGTFRDIADEVWSADPRADTHGAAWADFDNDGDEDLIELVGSAQGKGTGPNHLFVNQNGILAEKASSLGLDYPLGRGRTPIWLDADSDGKLDVLLVNRERPDRRAPSALFLQTSSGFRNSNATLGLTAARSSERKRCAKLLALARNLLRFRFWSPGSLNGRNFAQLADLSGDGRLDLLAWGVPTTIFDMSKLPFRDITYDAGATRQTYGFQDAAIQDLDGDLRADIFLVRSPGSSDIARAGPYEVRGHFELRRQKSQKVVFRTEGNVEFSFDPPWYVKPANILIGADGHHPEARSFSLSPEDAKLDGRVEPEKPGQAGSVMVWFTPEKRRWTIRASFLRYVNFVARSDKPIERLKAVNFRPGKGAKVDALLLHREDRFVPKMFGKAANAPTACHSVVAGDFDNDMDADLYLVCTGTVENLGNLLLENDGRANFAVVSDAGGSSGSRSGIGDSVVVADYDRDGFLDLFVANGEGAPPFYDDGPHQLFRNQGNGNHWVEIDLEGTVSNRDGIGAEIVVEAGGISQLRVQGGEIHRRSQNHQRIHFGLGDNRQLDRLTVRWPSGSVHSLEDIAADQVLLIREASALPRRAN
jgi:hypothetical protein